MRAKAIKVNNLSYLQCVYYLIPITNMEQTTIQPYTPSELLTLFSNFLNRQEEFTQIVYLQGIYQQKLYNPRWAACYDSIRDEKTAAEMTVRMTKEQHDSLTNGNLIVVGGVLGKQMRENGNIQVFLSVTRVDKLQEQVVDEAEVKRAAIRQQKAQAGYKNVDGVFERMLFADEQPQVALVFAESSITMTDFRAGLNSAMATVSFKEFRANFANPREVCSLLSTLDDGGFNAIAIVRGGGSGIEKLDELPILETVSNLRTPTIAAVGHPEERLFIKSVVDKEISTPNGLGQYFSELTERIADTKAKSKAALVAQVEKVYKDRLTAAEKQTQTLQQQMAAQMKQSQTILDQAEKKEEERKQLYGQISTLRKQMRSAKIRSTIIYVVLVGLIILLLYFQSK